MSNFLRSFLSSIVVFAALTSLASAQAPPQATAPAPGQPATTQQTPPRTPPRGRPGEQPPSKGTAIIRGTVVAADTGAPLRRVLVRASAPETRASGSTSSAADGKFEIKELPAGRYTVSVTKGAYVNMSYGQRRPSEPGTPIELADGQIAEKINFSMVKGGVVTGVITDDTGEPMTGVNMSVMRYQFQAGRRQLTPAGSSARTDDTGTYRIYGLAPGDYYVNAQGGFGVGTVVVSTAGSNTEESYAPTYYPGTPNAAEAQRFSIKVGQVLMGINFAVTPSRLASIRGRVLNSRGEPGRGMVMVIPADATGYSISTGPGNNIGADGSFLLANVAPGRYNLNVRPMGQSGPDAEFAIASITVGNDDLDNMMITTGTGVTARGLVQTDEGTPPPFRADEVQISSQTPEPMMLLGGGGAPKVNSDYTFELPALMERRLIRGSITNNPNWALKAVYFDGDDVTDSGIEFAGGRTYEGLQVVFTQKLTDLSGIVSDSRGRPVVDASVVVFSSSKDRWTTFSRYLRTVRPDTEGRYTVKGLPPGDDYVIIAVQGLESGQGGDPEFLARAREEAKSLTLAEGEKKAMDVRLSTLVP